MTDGRPFENQKKSPYFGNAWPIATKVGNLMQIELLNFNGNTDKFWTNYDKLVTKLR